jgi:hypothetical protein
VLESCECDVGGQFDKGDPGGDDAGENNFLRYNSIPEKCFDFCSTRPVEAPAPVLPPSTLFEDESRGMEALDRLADGSVSTKQFALVGLHGADVCVGFDDLDEFSLYFVLCLDLETFHVTDDLLVELISAERLAMDETGVGGVAESATHPGVAQDFGELGAC